VQRAQSKSKMDTNTLSKTIIGTAIEVHKVPGPGLLESSYEECFCHELHFNNLSFERQKSLPIKYKGIKLDCGYKLDIVVEDSIVLELKSCEKIQSIHKAQLLTYLKLTGHRLGFLLNFNSVVMRNGIVRMVNKFKE
jgi:GxxExxY protein